MSLLNTQSCPSCGHILSSYKNPLLTVDIVIEIEEEILLIERKNPPAGWALPGGFVDYGETVEAAAIREAKEETSMDVKLYHLLGVYSHPERDPRHHTVSVVFAATGSGNPSAQDDAKNIQLYNSDNLPKEIAFDHRNIIKEYFWWKKIKQDCGDHQ